MGSALAKITPLRGVLGVLIVLLVVSGCGSHRPAFTAQPTSVATPSCSAAVIRAASKAPVQPEVNLAVPPKNVDLRSNAVTGFLVPPDGGHVLQVDPALGCYVQSARVAEPARGQAAVKVNVYFLKPGAGTINYRSAVGTADLSYVIKIRVRSG